MATEPIVFSGVIKNGVIVPDANIKLPEGARVKITVISSSIPLELQAEFDAWDRLSDEAWEFIDQWEAETHK